MVDRVLFLGRQAEDIVNCFNLEEAVLRGKTILDCPGGPSSFCSAIRSNGGICVAVDPCYGMKCEDLKSLIQNDISEYAYRARMGISSQRSEFDVEAHISSFKTASKDFLDHYSDNPSCYVNASLPHLPFEDHSFDFVVSGHLLFVYSSRGDGGVLDRSSFDIEWHQEALLELVRVAREEVRIFPVHSFGAGCGIHSYLSLVLGCLPQGWMHHVTKSRYDQGHDAENDLLVLSRAQ